MAQITLDGIVLDGDLVWSDEFSWNPVERTSEYSITGALIVEESIKLAGRPITISTKPESASTLLSAKGVIWMNRGKAKDLYNKSLLTTHQMTLTLSDNRTFTVVFRENGIEAYPVIHIAPHQDSDPYYLTIKLMTV